MNLSDPENNFAENNVLNFLLSVGVIWGCIQIPIWLFYSGKLLEKDPLLAGFATCLFTALGFTIFFYKGSFLVKTAKFAGTLMLLSFVWYSILSSEPEKFLAMMKTSCKAGHEFACDELLIETERVRDRNWLEGNQQETEFDRKYRETMQQNEELISNPKKRYEFFKNLCDEGKSYACDELFLQSEMQDSRKWLEGTHEDQKRIEELDKLIERDRKVIEGIRQKYNR